MGIKTEREITAIMLSKNSKTEGNATHRPTLFTCYGHIISEYRLSRYQTLGRSAGNNTPDIPIHASFVSRDHGFFLTEENNTCYNASNTTNPIKYRGVFLEAGDRVELKDGDELIIPWADEEGKDQSVILVYADTEERIQFWRNLQEASRDNLTGLTDRRSFSDWWIQNKDKKDYCGGAYLFILDVDDFKRINDTKGHNAGDIVLKIIAEELKKAVRYENQVCRWGGDEFTGIIPASASSIIKRLERMRNNILEETALKGIPASVSIGYVNVRAAEDINNVVSMVELADQALYNVKQSGKNRIYEYT